MRKSKEPVCRKCISCGKITDRTLLFRIVKNRQGHVSFDISGHMEGRGAYLCRNAGCLDNAIKKNSLERSFRGRIDKTEKERLYKEISHFGSEQTEISSGTCD